MTDRAKKAVRAATLYARGLTVREVAVKMGISRSHASALISDPDGTKDRARKASYAGTCETCGAATDGSNGAANAPRFCHLCAPDAARIWTREVVVDAIQRFAAENGRPPIATDWRLTNRRKRYPASSVVYGIGRPFPSWADAIEAAGFERPRVGKREGDRHWDSPEILLAWMRENADDGIAPSSADHPSVRKVAAEFFGTWAAACEAAGLIARASLVYEWTDERVVEEIRALAIGDYPPRGKEDFTLRWGAIQVYGSWNAAVAAAGFEPYQTYDRERIRKRRDLVAKREARRTARRSRAASRTA